MTDYSELKTLLEACLAKNCDGPREFRKACEALFDVCSIETIAGLVAENERIAQASSCHLLRAQTVEAERDQLKAEIEALRKDAERYRWLRKDEVEQCRISRQFSEDRMDAEVDAAMGKGELHD